MIKSSVVSQTCGYRISFGSPAFESEFLKLAEPLPNGAAQAVLVGRVFESEPTKISLLRATANGGSRPERTL
jgi:hypothetical protein